jgi:hypothetical protein
MKEAETPTDPEADPNPTVGPARTGNAHRYMIALAFAVGLALGVVIGVVVSGPGSATASKHAESKELTDSERSLLSDVDTSVVMMMPGISYDGSYDVDDLIELEEQARQLRPIARAKGCAEFEDGDLVKDKIADLEETTNGWESIDELNSIFVGLAADMPKC